MRAESIPRYAQPTWEELNAADGAPTCGDCIFYREVMRAERGRIEYVGACVREVFRAETHDQLDVAELPYVEPGWADCDNFEKRTD